MRSLYNGIIFTGPQTKRQLKVENGRVHSPPHENVVDDVCGADILQHVPQPQRNDSDDAPSYMSACFGIFSWWPCHQRDCPSLVLADLHVACILIQWLTSPLGIYSRYEPRPIPSISDLASHAFPADSLSRRGTCQVFELVCSSRQRVTGARAHVEQHASFFRAVVTIGPIGVIFSASRDHAIPETMRSLTSASAA